MSVVLSSIDRMSSRSCRSGRRAAARDLVVEQRVDRRAHALRTRGRRSSARRRARRTSAARGSPSQSSSCASSARSRSSRVPKTARMMISSVSACMRGRVAIGSPVGHVATSASAISRISVAVGLHPLAVERRQQRLALGHVSGPSSSSTERAPSSGRRIWLPSPACSTFGSPVKTRLDVVGVRDHHPRRVALDVQRERVAVALAQPARVRPGPQDPPRRVEGERAARAGRKRHGCGFGLGLGFGLGGGWPSSSGAPDGPGQHDRARGVVDHPPLTMPDRVRTNVTSVTCDDEHVGFGRGGIDHALRFAVRDDALRGAAEALLGVLEQRVRCLAGERVHALHDRFVAAFTTAPRGAPSRPWPLASSPATGSEPVNVPNGCS